MTKRQRLYKIQQVLEEVLDMKWQDRLVYDETTGYRKVSIVKDFGTYSTYVRLADKSNKGHIAKVKINGDNFSIEMEGVRIDASPCWQDILNEELVTMSK